MKELEKALKDLVAECYKGKHQHGNAELKKALENGEAILIQLKKDKKDEQKQEEAN